MADFKNSFKVAIEASIQVDQARVEIKSIFAALNEQLDEVSNGTAKIEVFSTSERITEEELPEFARLAVNFLSAGKRRSYWAIAVKHRAAKDFSREIARWRQHAHGYPCWIITDGKETACGDRISLEQQLSELMSAPSVGSAIRAAMAHLPPAPKIIAAEASADSQGVNQDGLPKEEKPPEESSGDSERQS
jgi:hypothetical protein